MPVTQNRQSAPLYDVTVSFNQALAQARRDRGEPDDGISRKIYDAKLWIKTNQKQAKNLGLTVIAAGLFGTAVLILLRRRGAEVPEFPMRQTDLIQENPAA